MSRSRQSARRSGIRFPRTIEARVTRPLAQRIESALRSRRRPRARVTVIVTIPVAVAIALPWPLAVALTVPVGLTVPSAAPACFPVR
jgi:hypothetical protein